MGHSNISKIIKNLFNDDIFCVCRDDYRPPLMFQALLLCKSRSCFGPKALSESQVAALVDGFCEHISSIRNFMESKKEVWLREFNLMMKTRYVIKKGVMSE